MHYSKEGPLECPSQECKLLSCTLLFIACKYTDLLRESAIFLIIDIHPDVCVNVYTT